MIISASRRTDIPAFYSKWFFKRIDEGFVCVRNPMNPRQVSKISLKPDDVEGIVFWTKNPAPMLGLLDRLKGYPYYFQFTLNAYGKDVEPGVPSKAHEVTDTFRRLSDIIGPERTIWRYDPVFISDTYNIEYHICYFEKLAAKLSGYTDTCTFSFMDIYRNTLKNMSGLGLKEFSQEEIHIIAKSFSDIAKNNGIRLQTCAEEIDLGSYGIRHARCIDGELLARITGDKYKYSKDPNQRKECGCMVSTDIGAYDCCMHGCRYCYATHSPSLSMTNYTRHDSDSSLLIGGINPDDRITEKKNARVSCSQLKIDI